MYTNNRDSYRAAFFIAWQKYQKKLPLESIEAELVNVMLMHPEYNKLLDQADHYQHQEFISEENPFLHMGLHQALHEQLNTNRPLGIKHYYQLFCQKFSDHHQAEHEMMACLAHIIWQAQQSGVLPSDEAYLNMLAEKVR